LEARQRLLRMSYKLREKSDLNTKLTDNELWEAFKKGDSALLGELFLRYYKPLYQYGSKSTNDQVILEDCIQELFLELGQNTSQTEVHYLKGYLFKAFKYKLHRMLARKNKFTHQEIDDEFHFELSHDTLIIKEEENREQKERVLNAFSKLSNRQKEIIYLKYYQQLNYDEISEVMNINYQTARNLLHKSILSLRKLITIVAPIGWLLN
jgi:RNA polymerase sigma factor (sigma-70 family)